MISYILVTKSGQKSDFLTFFEDPFQWALLYILPKKGAFFTTFFDPFFDPFFNILKFKRHLPIKTRNPGSKVVKKWSKKWSFLHFSDPRTVLTPNFFAFWKKFLFFSKKNVFFWLGRKNAIFDIFSSSTGSAISQKSTFSVFSKRQKTSIFCLFLKKWYTQALLFFNKTVF